MVDNILVPQNLTRVVEVRDTSEPLRKFLLDLLVEINMLKKQVKVLEDKTKDL